MGARSRWGRYSGPPHHSEEGTVQQVINLTEGWSLTLMKSIASYADEYEWIFHHKCDPNSSIVGRLQKNTHKRHGIRYRCTLCKAIAPNGVIGQMKLKKLGDML
jgi:hypothetical protein